jgi:hypothetical protein
MCCCETIIDGYGRAYECDREEDHDGDHSAGFIVNREVMCSRLNALATVTWAKAPCLEHPTGPHASKEFIEEVRAS